MAGYRLNDAALADLDRIYENGILIFGRRQADKYYDGLLLYFKTIADSPLSHVGVDEIRAGYRRATYYGNSVYYRVAGEGVEIVRILGRQDPRKALFEY
ncbi:MAG: type II toxin-antitoxin system RelE/ParE family toxin [Alphaproteobacteria bacterium]